MSSSTYSQSTCSVCNSELSDGLRYCTTCNTDVGAPNVRLCRTEENIKALIDRYDESKKNAESKGCLKEFTELEKIIQNKSGVVVSMPAGAARKLLEDPTSIYQNYEHLVKANVRKPALRDNDRERSAVGGLIFGSYANSIIYGLLSFTENGLSTYGGVHCRLRNITIDKRTSFLEYNSYKFVDIHSIKPYTVLPNGYMSCWEYRHNLTLAKLASSLSQGQDESDWQEILIKSDGKNRKNDDFIEAHIYDSFDKNAIESVVKAANKKFSKSEQLDFDMVLDLFNYDKGKI